MQPAGRRKVVDLALQGGAAARRSDAIVALCGAGSRLKAGRHGVPTTSRARRRLFVLAAAERRHHLADHRRVAGAQHSSASDFWSASAGIPVTENFGALAPIYGTLVTSLIAMVIAVPIGLMIAMFLTELVPDVAAPADRHRDRAARRHSEHHLRHLGPVRVRAVPAGHAAAVPDRDCSATSRCFPPCSPDRPTASAC